MQRGKGYVLTSIIILFLTGIWLQGCGKKETNTVQETGAVIRPYGKITTNLKITPDFFPCFYLIKLTDTHCYFGEEVIEEEQEEYFYRYKFYSKPLDPSAEAQMLLEINGPFVLAFDVAKNTRGEDILCILTREEEQCVLTEYTLEGNVEKQFVLTDEEFVKASMGEILRYEDGSYVAYNSNVLYCFDEKGNVSKGVKCPGSYFLKGILADDIAYMVYDKNSTLNSYMAKVDKKSGTLSEETSLPGRGNLFARDQEGNLVQLTENALYHINTKENRAEKKMDLAEYNIPFSKIILWGFQQEEIRMISWNHTISDPVQLITLTPKTEEELAREQAEGKENPSDVGKYDADGKRIITIYDPTGLLGPDINLLGTYLIEDFNTENEKYSVVVDYGNRNVETVLASKDSPDLMFNFDCTVIETYQKNGYLADLKPFLEKSQVIPLDELQESVVDAFTFDGGIYALPQYATLGTLMGLESQLEGRTSWTVDEFLGWLEQNPDVETTMGIDKDVVLEYCLKGNLEHYIDFEQGTADLTGEDFKSMLTRIKPMEINTEGGSYETSEDYDIEKTRFFNEYLHYAFQITELAHNHNDKIVNLGFPSDDGEPKVLLDCVTNLSILEKSECKEGAFAFMEYCLTYEFSLPINDKEYNRWLWTHKPRWEKECASAKEHVRITGNWEQPETMQKIVYTITPEDEEMVYHMLNNAVPDNYEKKHIREIIMEEVQPYFLEQKDLDTVCDIMQSRVSILLSEGR